MSAIPDPGSSGAPPPTPYADGAARLWELDGPDVCHGSRSGYGVAPPSAMCAFGPRFSGSSIVAVPPNGSDVHLSILDDEGDVFSTPKKSNSKHR
jgi:hypothetical protein